MADTQGIKAGGAYVVLGVDMSPLKKGIDAASGYLKALGAGIMAVGVSSMAAGGLLSGGLLEATNILRAESVELLRANQLTGIGTERLAGMGYAAVQLGGDLEDVTHGMAHMANFLREVRDGSRSAMATLDRLGISAEALLNTDLESAYYRLGSATNALTNSTERLIIARQILGRHGVGTLGVFGAGREQFQGHIDEASRRGLLPSAGDTAAGVLLERQWNQMLATVKALMIQIGVGLVPQWEFLLNLVKGGAEIVTRFIRTNRELVPWLDRLATGLTIGGAAFVGLGTGIGVASLLLRQFIPLLAAGWSAVTGFISVLMTLAGTLIGIAVAPFQMLFAAFTGLAGMALSAAGSIAGAMLSMAVTATTAAASMAGSVAAALVSMAATAATAAASMALSIMAGIGSAIGFLISTVVAAVPMIGTLVGAIGVASTAAAFGAGPFGILNAFLAGLGITSAGTSGLLGVLSAAVTAAAVAEAIGSGPTGALAAALTVLGASSGVVGFILGALSPILAMLGINLGIATTGTTAYTIGAFVAGMASSALAVIWGGLLNAAALAVTAGTWLFNVAVAAFNVVVTIAEALTGAWAIPLVLLGIALAAVAAVLLAPIVLGMALIGVFAQLAIVAGVLAAVLMSVAVPLLVAGFALLVPLLISVISLVAVLGVALLSLVVVIGGIVALVASALYLAWLSVGGVAIVVWGAIKDAAAAVWVYFKAAAAIAWSLIKTAAGAVWDWVTNKAGAVWDWMVGIAAGAWDRVKSAAGAVWDWIAGVATSTWDRIVGAASSAWDAISTLGRNIGAIFGTIFESIQVGNLSDALDVVWAAIQLGWIQTVNALELAWLDFKYWIDDAFTAAWNGMLNAATAGWAYFMYGLRAGWIEIVRYARLALHYADPTIWGDAAEQARAQINAEADAARGSAARDRDEGIAGSHRATGPDDDEVERRRQEREAARGQGEEAEQRAQDALDAARRRRLTWQRSPVPSKRSVAIGSNSRWPAPAIWRGGRRWPPGGRRLQSLRDRRHDRRQRRCRADRGEHADGPGAVAAAH